MRAMQQEILRWHKPYQSHRFSDRWTNWSRLLISRYDRVIRPHRALTMVLMQSHALLLFRCQRWEQVGWNLSPAINFAIAPFLREVVWKKSLLLQQHEAQIITRRQSPVRKVLWGKSFLVPQNGAQGVASEQALARERVLNKDAGVFITSPPRLEIPLFRIIQRQQRNESNIEIRRQSLNVQTSLRLVQRVVEQRQRGEEKIQRPAASMAVKRSFSAEGQSFQKQAQKYTPAVDEITFPRTPPEMNLQQLTDQVLRQIDDRFIAYRERMGKVF